MGSESGTHLIDHWTAGKTVALVGGLIGIAAAVLAPALWVNSEVKAAAVGVKAEVREQFDAHEKRPHIGSELKADHDSDIARIEKKLDAHDQKLDAILEKLGKR
jgi:hypothetical protein